MLPVKYPEMPSTMYLSQVFPELGYDANPTMGSEWGAANRTEKSLHKSSSGHGKCVLKWKDILSGHEEGFSVTKLNHVGN